MTEDFCRCPGCGMCEAAEGASRWKAFSPQIRRAALGEIGAQLELKSKDDLTGDALEAALELLCAASGDSMP